MKPSEKKIIVYESCPHCGRLLSPWERVLLNVDRALMCKSCWYRIYLDPIDDIDTPTQPEDPKSKPKG